MKNSLGDYQKSPSKDLWPEIERKLDKQDKKRTVVIPLWWKTGAIVTAAASLALILLLNPSQDTDNNILDNAISEIEQSPQFERDLQENAQEKSSNALASGKLNEANEPNLGGDLTSSTDQTTEARLAVIPETKTDQNDPITDLSNAVVENTETDFNQLTEKSKATLNPSEQPSKVQYSSEIANSDTEIVGVTAEIADVDIEDIQTGNTENPESSALSENITGPLVQQLTGPVTSLVADEEGLSDLLKDESKNQTWSIMPVAGPVYYNSLTQGSLFDPSLSDNARQGDVTFSYGLRVNLDLDNRLTLRAGVNNVAMGYATQDIEIATGPAAFGLSSVTYNDDRNIISVFDKGTVPANPDPSNPYNQLNLKSTTGETSLRANLNYLEFPIELSYALIDQQVKLSVISGVSGLLLNNNEVSVSDGQNRYVLGSLNNLNEFSFSTNIGLGLNYKVFKGLNLLLEPTFKYQLGAYKDANVDFTPYQLLLLSGLQFQF